MTAWLRYIVLRLGFGWCILYRDDAGYWTLFKVTVFYEKCWRARCRQITNRTVHFATDQKRCSVVSIREAMRQINWLQAKQKRPMLKFVPTIKGYAVTRVL